MSTSTQQRHIFEHVDRLGRVSPLPLGKEIQKLFAAAENGSRSALQTDTPIKRPAELDICQAAQRLTLRQWQVFDFLIAGLSSKQIAHELSISPRTVDIHRSQLMQKLGVRNIASLVRVALMVA
jgi:FixJ family two-component response regulator